MEAMITTVAELYQKLSFIDSFIFFLYCLIGSAIYFFFRIYMPQRLKEREAETKNEQRKMALAEKAFQEFDVMLKTNTETIKDLGQAIQILNQTFEKVSDKLYEQNSMTVPNYNPNKKTHQKLYSCVGTAFYVAPEVLIKKGYNQEIVGGVLLLFFMKC